MLDAGICDGDIVVVTPQPDARNGDIVVALIDDDPRTKEVVIGCDDGYLYAWTADGNALAGWPIGPITD